jgi:hypothetical protein
LFNVGFKYTRSEGHTYYCFHDVDLIPIEADYSEPTCPTHLSKFVQQYGWKPTYNEHIGGVLLCPTEIFVEVNGFCNDYWGWGCEDDDLYHRFFKKDIPVERRSGVYWSCNHPSTIDDSIYKKNEDRLFRFRGSIRPIEEFGGLNNLKYKLVSTSKVSGVDKILVSL